MKKQVVSVQALRGIAAAMVVIAHSFEHGHAGNDFALFSGRFGVDIFFIISGFVITLAAGDTRFDPWVFARHRFFRVVPLYWLTTLIVAITAYRYQNLFRTTVFDFEYFWKSMLFVPVALPGDPADWRPLFKLGWTLNYEIFFYLIVMLLFWCRNIRVRSAILVAVMLAFVGCSFFVERRGGIFAFYANLNLLPFMVGVLLCFAYRHWQGGMAWLGKFQPVLIALLVPTIIYTSAIPFKRFTLPDGHLPLTFAATMVALTALASEKFFTAHHRFWAWLGDISFSLYLLHMFVIGASWAIMAKLGIAFDFRFQLIGIAAMVAISLILASLSYRYFERPINELGRRVRSSRTPDITKARLSN
ncbi:MAG: acyltransferase [Sphingobium sp.]